MPRMRAVEAAVLDREGVSLAFAACTTAQVERVAHIAMGTEADRINEFEEILCPDPTMPIRMRSERLGRIEPAAKLPQPPR